MSDATDGAELQGEMEGGTSPAGGSGCPRGETAGVHAPPGRRLGGETD